MSWEVHQAYMMCVSLTLNDICHMLDSIFFPISCSILCCLNYYMIFIDLHWQSLGIGSGKKLICAQTASIKYHSKKKKYFCHSIPKQKHFLCALHAIEFYLNVGLPAVSYKLNHIPVKSPGWLSLSPRSCSIIHCLWSSSRIYPWLTSSLQAEQLKKGTASNSAISPEL